VLLSAVDVLSIQQVSLLLTYRSDPYCPGWLDPDTVCQLVNIDTTHRRSHFENKALPYIRTQEGNLERDVGPWDPWGHRDLPVCRTNSHL